MINKIRAKVKKKMSGGRESRMPLRTGAINEANEKQGLGCYFSGQGGIQGGGGGGHRGQADYGGLFGGPPYLVDPGWGIG
jgi:hypothetical protein